MNRRLSAASVMVACALFPLAGNAQVSSRQQLSITEVGRYKLPDGVVPEFVVRIDSRRFAIGEKGVTPQFWMTDLQQTPIRTTIRCAVKPEIVASTYEGFLIVDTTNGKLLRVLPNGECIPEFSSGHLRNSVAAVIQRGKVIVVSRNSNGFDVTTLDTKGVRLNGVQIGRALRRPAVSAIGAEHSIIVDRSYPFHEVALSSRRWTSLSEQLQMLDDHAVDSLWIALPVFSGVDGELIQTMADLRSSRRLIIRRTCEGRIVSTRAIARPMSLVSLDPNRMQLLAFDMEPSSVAVVTYSINLPNPEPTKC